MPRWYFLSIGLVNGYIPGVFVCLGLLFGDGQMVILLLAFTAVCISPLLGLWWIATRKVRPLDLDYDDEMTGELGNRNRLIDLPSLPATESFGRHLGSLLFPNAVVALIGPLGAGKTHLSRAIAEGLDIANPAAVTSPTFTLIHEYPARLPIYHFDAYRLNSANEFLDLGVNEYYEAGGVCLIEWADRVETALPEERLTIRIEIVDENRRRLTLNASGGRYATMIASLREESHQ
jgi:tRNA threonylcarbamoyladenosine biosynthesis protein TsaE